MNGKLFLQKVQLTALRVQINLETTKAQKYTCTPFSSISWIVPLIFLVLSLKLCITLFFFYSVKNHVAMACIFGLLSYVDKMETSNQLFSLSIKYTRK